MLAEVGSDMTRFETEAHFVSFLGLSRGTKSAAGKWWVGKSKQKFRSQQISFLAKKASGLGMQLVQTASPTILRDRRPYGLEVQSG